MVLMFTSGTTGLSKGVMMSERNLFSAGHVLWAISAQLADKIDLTKPLPGHYMVLPMFHLGAFIDLFSTTVMGWPLNLRSESGQRYPRLLPRYPEDAQPDHVCGADDHELPAQGCDARTP